jgi:hypothetical protein
MATLTKKNETVVAPFYKNGVTLQFFQIDFGADVSAKLDTDYTNYPNAPRSPVAVALEAIAQTCSIEVIGTVDATGGTGQGLRFAVAAIGGAYGSDTYDGTNTDTLAEHLEDLVIAAGTHQGVNLASATVVAFAL